MPFANRSLVLFASIISLALWSGWLISLTLGNPPLDKFGNLFGPDFLHMYSASVSYLNGNAAAIYDTVAQNKLQKELVGIDFEHYSNFYLPPFYVLYTLPFAMLDYIPAFISWAVFSCGLFYFALKLLKFTSNTQLLICASFFPLFATISYGQNSALTLILFTFSFICWKSNANLLAGLTLSLTLYKPPFALGILALWLLKKDWQAILGFVSGALILLSLSFSLLPEASAIYLNLLQTKLFALNESSGFPIDKQMAIFAFFFLLIPDYPNIAAFISLAVKLIMTVSFIFYFLRIKLERKELLFSMGVILGLILSPHCMIYDYLLLLLAGVLLTKTNNFSPQVKITIFSIVWLSSLLGPILVSYQLSVMPVALQVGSLGLISTALIMLRHIGHRLDKSCA